MNNKMLLFFKIKIKLSMNFLFLFASLSAYCAYTDNIHGIVTRSMFDKKGQTYYNIDNNEHENKITQDNYGFTLITKKVKSRALMHRQLKEINNSGLRQF